MKIFDTLTEEQQLSLISGNTVGFFPELLISSDSFYDKLYDICFGYYMTRSGNKTISPTYERLLKLQQPNNTAESLLAKLIRGKFIDKWQSVYEALLAQQYSILDGKVSNVKRTGNNTELTEYNTTDRKTGSNTDTDTYNLQKDTESKVATDIKTESDSNDKNKVYGFNSTSPVDSDILEGIRNERQVGDKDKNTTDEKENRTGTLAKNIEIDESIAKSGSDNKTMGIDEDITINGRNSSGAEMVEKELNLRNKFLFFDIIYKDIDSIATLEIYI